MVSPLSSQLALLGALALPAHLGQRPAHAMLSQRQAETGFTSVLSGNYGLPSGKPGLSALGRLRLQPGFPGCFFSQGLLY